MTSRVYARRPKAGAHTQMLPSDARLRRAAQAQAQAHDRIRFCKSLRGALDHSDIHADSEPAVRPAARREHSLSVNQSVVRDVIIRVFN
jgi:hypothetical protein